MLRSLARLPHCALIPILLAALCPGQGAPFEQHDPAHWADRIRADRAATIAALRDGAPASLPVLGELLQHEVDEVVQRAADACAAIGPDARRLSPLLLRQLRTADSWWTQLPCADALAALGTDDPEVLAALLGPVRESTVPHLRQVCARAFGRLTPDAAARLLGAVDRAEFGDADRAVDALAAIGTPTIAALVDAVSRQTASGDVARRALAQIGWRTIPALERAGHPELVASALLTAPIRHARISDDYVLELGVEPTPDPRLPAITWEAASGHGGDLRLFRAGGDDRGLLVEVITLSTPRTTEPGAPTVTVSSTRLSRELAAALTRQIVALAHMSVRPRDPAHPPSWWSSGDFHARVHVRIGDTPVVDETFTGHPTGGNAAGRFRAQTAVAVLGEALADAEWTGRPARPEDLACAVERRQALTGGVKWVEERFVLMATQLQPR